MRCNKYNVTEHIIGRKKLFFTVEWGGGVWIYVSRLFVYCYWYCVYLVVVLWSDGGIAVLSTLSTISTLPLSVSAVFCGS